MGAVRKKLAVAWVGAFVVAVALTGGSPSTATPGPATGSTGEVVVLDALAPGIEHTSRRLPGPIAVEVVTVEAGTNIELKPVVHSDRVNGARETTTSMCSRAGGIVCVNASFSVCPTCLQPFGGLVRDRVLLRNPTADQDNLTLVDGRLSMAPWGWFGRLESPLGGDPRTLEVTGLNIPREGDLLVAYTREFGARTGTSGAGLEVVIRGEPPVLNQPQAVEILDVRTTANNPIPVNAVVLSAAGAGAARLQAWVDAVRGAPAPVSMLFGASKGLQHAVSGHPVLVRNGVVQSMDGNDGKVVNRHPRTVVGWNAEGDVWFVVVDGRQEGHSVGMTLPEAAQYLLDLGATEAMNLDGGGSSTMVTSCGSPGWCVRNRPSDGTERPVWTALAVTYPNTALAGSPQAETSPAYEPPAPPPPPAPVVPSLHVSAAAAAPPAPPVTVPETPVVVGPAVPGSAAVIADLDAVAESPHAPLASAAKLGDRLVVERASPGDVVARRAAPAPAPKVAATAPRLERRPWIVLAGALAAGVAVAMVLAPHPAWARARPRRRR